MLKRAPVFLRVVTDGEKWDALDQLEDFPRASERAYAYQLTAPPGVAMVDGPKCRGAYTIAEYKAVPEPPSEETMRDNRLWSEWALARATTWKW